MRYCVFSGSSTGVRAEYAEAARALGRLFVREGIGLVYGGASVGLMGAISDAVIDAGGEAIGVIPRDLVEKELASTRVRDLRVTSSMHERKAEKLLEGMKNYVAPRADKWIGLKSAT